MADLYLYNTSVISDVPPYLEQAPLTRHLMGIQSEFTSEWKRSPSMLLDMALLRYPLVRRRGGTGMGDLPAKDILDAVEGLGASNVRVFGSRARGDARSDSDLDLLASFPRGTTLFDIAGLELALEQLLGIKVDIFTEGSLRPSMKEQILAEARPLIAA